MCRITFDPGSWASNCEIFLTVRKRLTLICWGQGYQPLKVGLDEVIGSFINLLGLLEAILSCRRWGSGLANRIFAGMYG